MSTPDVSGVVLVTSTGNTYAVPGGVRFSQEQNPTTGYLAVVVYAPGPRESSYPVAGFGNVEAVFLAGAVTAAADLKPEANSPAAPPT